MSRIVPTVVAGVPPSISIVTPSLNQARFIGMTLRSVLGQGYPTLEYLVQDGCSSDDTPQILSRFVGKGVQIQTERDEGQADALNRGFRRTSGEVMAYLNSDDMFLPGTLQFVGAYFENSPTVDVVYGNRLIVDENGFEVGRWILPRNDPKLLRYVDYVPQESLFWRRRIWDQVGGHFDANLHFALDWDLILRFLDVGAEVRHVPDLFGVFRVHESQKTQAERFTRGAEEIAALRARSGWTGGQRIAHAIRHWGYLSAHKRADRAFEATIVNWKKGL